MPVEQFFTVFAQTIWSFQDLVNTN